MVADLPAGCDYCETMRFDGELLRRCWFLAGPSAVGKTAIGLELAELLQAEIVSTKQMADDILKGIEEGQFVAWYQPQFDARTLKISGVEALARWEHPTRGVSQRCAIRSVCPFHDSPARANASLLTGAVAIASTSRARAAATALTMAAYAARPAWADTSPRRVGPGGSVA